jgi:hypothetical protein
MDRAALAESTSENLGRALAQVQAIEHASAAAKLELLSLCEERKVWVEDGCASMESWVAMHLGVAWRTAAEWMRVARGLDDRPVLAETFAQGGLSWDKLRAVVTLSTLDDEGEWAQKAPAMTVAELERTAKAARERSEAEAAARNRERTLHLRPHRDLPVSRIFGWVPNDMAAVIGAAIDAEAETLPPNPETGQFDPYPSRRLDALYKICSKVLGVRGNADRATVVVHTHPDGTASFDDGTAVPASVADWMSCDCREQYADGSISDSIPRRLRRRILRRYGHCTFPNCEQRHWLQVHHIIHRSQGGPTEEWNLRPDCPFHHRVLHQPGWRVTWDEQGELHYFRPDGVEVKTKPPPPMEREVRERFDSWLAFDEHDLNAEDPDDTS